ncbi:MAG: hypothetical protein HY578_07785, partial [Nitrospinae bacterium]|nr:hypothetical protein [Nitrospinota bacterium]
LTFFMCIFLVFDNGEETGFSHLKFPYSCYYCIKRIDKGYAIGTNESLCPFLASAEECPDFCQKDENNND